MLCSIRGLTNIEESKGTKKDTTMTLCPFLYFVQVHYGFALTQEKT